jgi:hypothetical protein
MSSERRHALQLDDLDVTVIQRALLAFHAVLTIQTGPHDLPETRRAADDAARVSGLVLAHTKASCGCPPPKGVSE